MFHLLLVNSTYVLGMSDCIPPVRVQWEKKSILWRKFLDFLTIVYMYAARDVNVNGQL